MGKTLAKIIGYILVLALVAAAIGLVYKFTNGFNEDFKTFYVEYNGKQILSSETKLELDSGATHTFKVKYTFDKDDAEPKEYNVKIVPRITKDFDYTVDGERYIASKLKEFTPVFDLKKEATSFTFTIPSNLTFEKAFSALYSGKMVSIPQDAATNNPYPYQLVISSYNEKVVYKIYFNIDDTSVKDMTIDQPGVVFPYDPNNPESPDNPSENDTPTPPTVIENTIEYLTLGDATDLSDIRITSERKAVQGEKVRFTVAYNINEYKLTDMSVTVWNSNETINIENDGSGYFFIMPNSKVTVWIYFELVEQDNFYLIEYDCLGSGGVVMNCPAKAKEGETVKLTATADGDDLKITHVVLRDWDGEDIEDYYFNDKTITLTFTMPDHNVSFMFYVVPLDW